MAKHLLTAVQVRTLDKPGRHADGGGLYLVIDRYGKRWALLFQMRGKRREMGLGAYPAVSLAMARDKAEAARQAVQQGVDPIAAKKVAPKAEETFASFSERLIDDLKGGWSGAKTEAGWRRS